MKKNVFLLIGFQIILFTNLFAQNNNYNSSKCIPEIDTIGHQVAEHEVDHPPEYPDGMTAFYKELAKRVMSSSKDSSPKKNYSNLEFTFVIDTLGNMRNFCVFHPNDMFLAQEDITEMNKIHQWHPAEKHGEKVPVRLVLSAILEFYK